MDKSLELFRVPRELGYLTSEGALLPSSLRSVRADDQGLSTQIMGAPALSATASRRLAGLFRLELSGQQLSTVHPTWLDGLAVPRLLVSTRYAGLDAFGASRSIARLDLAARRAGALSRQLLKGEKVAGWPHPMRTHRGGLHLLDANVGSFNALMTVWGALVAIAGSSPVSVASLIALAWDVGRGTARLANGWVGAAVIKAPNSEPTVEAPASSVPWGIEHTKALAPVLADAIANDQGVEFFLVDGDQQLKITVLPKE